jgi:hypothetical protein
MAGFIGNVFIPYLFIISPAAGRNMIADAQIGEFFRVFVSVWCHGCGAAASRLAETHCGYSRKNKQWSDFE